jgi:hypothetical protein
MHAARYCEAYSANLSLCDNFAPYGTTAYLLTLPLCTYTCTLTADTAKTKAQAVTLRLSLILLVLHGDR